MLREYPVKGEKIFVISDAEFTAKGKTYGWSNLKAKLIGGFCFPHSKEIYIRESRKLDVKLLNHERGHLRGFKHTWYPTLMFPSWVGRWINRYIKRS